jgi:hypothetical protein
LPPLRTVKMVVPCQTGVSDCDACMENLDFGPDLGIGTSGCNRSRLAADFGHHRPKFGLHHAIPQ